MSAPPQLIHIKRKRGDEDAPVTYLRTVPPSAPIFSSNILKATELEPGSKRHLTSSSWVYRRRIAAVKSSKSGAGAPVKPVIQPSKPGDELSHANRSPRKAVSQPAPSSPSDVPTSNAAAHEGQTPSASGSQQRASNPAIEPRRFHMSRSAMSSPSGSTILRTSGVSKRGRYGTAVFVERGKKKAAKRLSAALESARNSPEAPDVASTDVDMADDRQPAPKKPLAKRPPRAAAADVDSQRKPMPAVAPTDDMNKIAADMDQWVLHEIGLNLKSMEQQTRPPTAASPSRFKPKAPAKRFAERHPDVARELDGSNRDEAMADAGEAEEEDESDDDYVIEVYELAPSKPLLANVPPEEIGVLQFDSQEDLELFYGNEDDDSDYDDDEDENAENHYTADYPEDEVDSEDEYDRHAYLFRNANASDEEEFDTRDLDDDDEDMYAMEGDERRDEEEVFQEKIRRYIRQHGSN
ncbi:hypothetical protein CSOJ01_01636 [Colletotrichum sojae]|uniref:Transcription factor Iwr1 domain-containing protein n=1 Tax=Colletotrichum sojae TaxID=2175907 RepID=A0A8H6JTC6_9PEZI|nr:hypothetical protein CSOJ01_01636 [Colletotrichum sojae]